MPRSKPFSGKQKKQQLKEKKRKKQEEENETHEVVGRNNRHDKSKERSTSASASRSRSRSTDGFRSEEDRYYPPKVELLTSGTSDDEERSDEERDDEEPEDLNSEEIVEEPQKNVFRRPTNRPDLRTVFDLETREEIEERKKEGLLPLDTSKREKPWSVLDDQAFLTQDHGTAEAKLNFIPMPKRPIWSYDTPPQVVKQKESEIFRKWLSSIKENYPPERLNYFERNIEVWRQLWRVSERSDAIMLITDARYPLFHFPPALYDYLVNDLKKPIILVLNKIDLVDRGTLSLWEDYFRKHYSEIHAIVKFNSFSRGNPNDEEDEPKKEFKKKRQHGRRRYEDAKGVEDLFDAIRALNIKNKITGDPIILPARSLRLQEEEEREEEEMKRKKKREKRKGHKVDSDDENEDNETEEEKERRRNAGMITIGTVGHPNVGKSSLINGLVGKKVVSTSRTPGHTKHFQTIRLTPEVQLCDCPGLVFPALDRPKALQILCGLFPLAQVRESFSAVRYMAERVPVEKAYGLTLPEDEDEWTPFGICEAYALKKGYVIARTGRPDVHRAGLELLRNCLDGELVISWPPPGTTEEMLASAKNAAKQKEKEIQDMLRQKKQIKKVSEEEAEDEEEEQEDDDMEEYPAEEIEETEEAVGDGEEVPEVEGDSTQEGEEAEEEKEEEKEEMTRTKKRRNRRNKKTVSFDDEGVISKPSAKNDGRQSINKGNNSNVKQKQAPSKVQTFNTGKNSKDKAKALEYQERLAERQNRRGQNRVLDY